MRWTSRIRHPRPSSAAMALLDADPRPVEEPVETARAAASASAPSASADEPHQAVTLQHLADVPVGCRVVVLGPPGALRTLPRALPPSWTVEHVEEVGDITVADLVVVTNPTPGKLGALQARQPDASLVGLTLPTAQVDTVVELLCSGATACVRSTDADLVAAHLIACARRYSVGAY